MSRHLASERFEEMLLPIKEELNGASIAIVIPTTTTPIMDLVLNSFESHLPRLGLDVRTISYAQLSDLYSQSTCAALKEAHVVVKILHGEDNRSGLLHAVLDSFQVRRAGHDARTDALSQHKNLVKQLMLRARVPTLPYLHIDAFTRQDDVDRFLDKLGDRPYIVKPNEGSASRGLMYASDIYEVRKMLASLKEAHIVEPYLGGRVVTVGVSSIRDVTVPIGAIEYVLDEGQFVMDATWKHSPLRREIRDLGPPVEKVLLAYATTLHELVMARGLTRSDFIVTDEGQIVALEINTNIGLSDCHDMAAVFRFNGLDYEHLLWAHLASALKTRAFIPSAITC